jgi:hypothetical protein
VRIRLLGGFGVDRGGEPVDARAWRLRIARTLVKLLALRRDQRLHRDVLLDALWPDHDSRRLYRGPLTGCLEVPEPRAAQLPQHMKTSVNRVAC